MSIFSAIGNAISRPVRGLGRIARGKFKQGFGDIGAGAKALGPILAATTGIGIPALLALGAGGGALEGGLKEGGGFGDAVKGAAGGAAGVGAGAIGRKLLAGASGVAGIDAPVAGFEGLASEAAGDTGRSLASNIGSRLAGAGRDVVGFAKENPEVAARVLGTAASTFGELQEGRRADEIFDFQREQIERTNRRQENVDPMIADIIRRLLQAQAA